MEIASNFAKLIFIVKSFRKKRFSWKVATLANTSTNLQCKNYQWYSHQQIESQNLYFFWIMWSKITFLCTHLLFWTVIRRGNNFCYEMIFDLILFEDVCVCVFLKWWSSKTYLWHLYKIMRNELIEVTLTNILVDYMNKQFSQNVCKYNFSQNKSHQNVSNIKCSKSFIWNMTLIVL